MGSVEEVASLSLEPSEFIDDSKQGNGIELRCRKQFFIFTLET